MDKRIISQKGFSLLEVMIALALFAVYATAIITTQSSNMTSSTQIKADLALHNLAELKMNESLIDVKKFTNATENDVDSGNFEIEGFKNFKFTVEYKKNEFPNFAQITGQDDEQDQSQDNALKKAIFEKLKKNIELMIWQVKVTVTNPDSNESAELKSWVTNKEAKLDTNFSI